MRAAGSLDLAFEGRRTRPIVGDGTTCHDEGAFGTMTYCCEAPKDNCVECSGLSCYCSSLSEEERKNAKKAIAAFLIAIFVIGSLCGLACLCGCLYMLCKPKGGRGGDIGGGGGIGMT